MKGKGKRNQRRNFDRNRRDQDQREYRNDRDDTKSAKNDVSWYSRNPNLLVAAGSFPYPYRPGMTMSLGSVTNPGDTVGTAVRNVVIPGVIAIDWMPAIGTSNQATDPASVLGKEIYSRVRKVYSGSLDADAPDYVMYIMALSSIFSYIAWLKRIYRLLTAWSPDNYALPDTLLASMGFTIADIEALRADRTKLWQSINELVLQSRKFSCPASMDIINRHYWMSDNVYTDAMSINSQMYLFNLRACFKFSMLNMSDGKSGPGLQCVVLPTLAVNSNTVMSVAALYDFGLDLINALVAWDDAYTINGYMKRAFEGEAMFIVDELPVDQPFNPVYEPEVLTQIENLRVVPGMEQTLATAALSGFNITQDVMTNAVIANPSFTYNGAGDAANSYKFGQAWTIPPTLSIRSDAPTVADSVVATRLQANFDATQIGSTSQYQVTIHCATEVPMAMRYFETSQGTLQFPETTRFGLMANSAIQQFPVGWISGFSTKAFSPSALYFKNLLSMEQFDWHPFTFFVYYTTSGTAETKTPAPILSIVGDVHNMTIISETDLLNLHKICIYSELNSFGF